MLESLDPHSQFMEPDDFKGMQDDTNSRFGGLGVVVTERDDKLIIVSPMEDTPGFRAGLLPGDQILKIDGVSTEKMSLNDAITKLRGDAGQKVTLTIYRASSKEYKDFEMVREIVKVTSVKEAKLLNKEQTGDFKIGYARITQFNVPTSDELAHKLDELEKEGMQAFILDLRYNPGGLLNSAVDVAGQFLEPGKLVVSTEGRVQSQDKIYRVSGSMKSRPHYQWQC
jgi:carboxyl-terminal processing protease